MYLLKASSLKLHLQDKYTSTPFPFNSQLHPLPSSSPVHFLFLPSHRTNADRSEYQLTTKVLQTVSVSTVQDNIYSLVLGHFAVYRWSMEVARSGIRWKLRMRDVSEMVGASPGAS